MTAGFGSRGPPGRGLLVGACPQAGFIRITRAAVAAVMGSLLMLHWAIGGLCPRTVIRRRRKQPAVLPAIMIAVMVMTTAADHGVPKHDHGGQQRHPFAEHGQSALKNPNCRN